MGTLQASRESRVSVETASAQLSLSGSRADLLLGVRRGGSVQGRIDSGAPAAPPLIRVISSRGPRSRSRAPLGRALVLRAVRADEVPEPPLLFRRDVLVAERAPVAHVYGRQRLAEPRPLVRAHERRLDGVAARVARVDAGLVLALVQEVLLQAGGQAGSWRAGRESVWGRRLTWSVAISTICWQRGHAVSIGHACQ